MVHQVRSSQCALGTKKYSLLCWVCGGIIGDLGRSGVKEQGRYSRALLWL